MEIQGCISQLSAVLICTSNCYILWAYPHAELCIMQEVEHYLDIFKAYGM